MTNPISNMTTVAVLCLNSGKDVLKVAVFGADRHRLVSQQSTVFIVTEVFLNLYKNDNNNNKKNSKQKTKQKL